MTVLDRRSLLLGFSGLLVVGPALADDPAAALAAIEAQTGGRLGVAVLDTNDGSRFGHRADERFPFCSTAKLLIAALILHRVDLGQEDLGRRIPFSSADLVDYSPVTTPWAPSGGARLGDLMRAAVVQSDNTAANLMISTFGGPAGVTAAIRAIGDDTIRFDRLEPALNSAIPGDERDTTTPRAMVDTMQRFFGGGLLGQASRDRLVGMAIACVTGTKRLRAAVPTDWIAGDKTGAGANATANDVAFFRAPGRRPILIAAYLTGATVPPADRDAAIAAVGRLVVDHTGRA